MSDTPKTDVLREVIFGQYKEDELTGNGMGNILAALTDIETLERERECECKCDVDWPEEYYELRQRLERERDELRSDLEFRRGLFQLQEKQLNEVRAERDKWKAKYIQQNKDLGCEMMDPAGTIWDHAKKLQDENKTLQEQLEFERELNKHKAVADAIGIGEAVGESIKDRIDALQEQLDAALMLGKMQERRHERDLEELITAAKAVIDRWETPFWKEAAHTGAYIAALRKAVEITEGGHL